jgi:hypothetical protein
MLERWKLPSGDLRCGAALKKVEKLLRNDGDFLEFHVLSGTKRNSSTPVQPESSLPLAQSGKCLHPGWARWIRTAVSRPVLMIHFNNIRVSTASSSERPPVFHVSRSKLYDHFKSRRMCYILRQSWLDCLAHVSVRGAPFLWAWVIYINDLPLRTEMALFSNRRHTKLLSRVQHESLWRGCQEIFLHSFGLLTGAACCGNSARCSDRRNYCMYRLV